MKKLEADLADLAQVLDDVHVPAWQRGLLLEADWVERFYGSRYIRVPEADSHEGFRDMEAFISTVEDEHLQNELWRAINERKPFRRFKDVLADHYREQKYCLLCHSRESGNPGVVDHDETASRLYPGKQAQRHTLYWSHQRPGQACLAAQE